MATVTAAEAVQAVAVMVRDRLPVIPGANRHWVDEVAQLALDPGFQGFLSDRVVVEWERGWAVGADLSVSIRKGDASKVKVGWSSTGRTPVEAVAATALYAQVAALACEIQAFLDRTVVA